MQTEKEQIQNQIQELQEKLKKLEELSQTKSPVEECYKDWWGQYPETGTWDGFDEKRWQGFQAGYEFAYAISTAKEVMEKVQEEPKDNEWKSVALRFGEELVSIGPCGYYEFTAEEWFDWVVNTYEKICDDTVKLLKKKYPYKKYTPEETEQSLKSAFREAVKQGVVSYTKSPTFYNVIAEWWSDVFTSGFDTETCIDDLVDRIEAFLPKPQSAEGSQNAYVESAVEGFNDCLQKIKSRLR